LLLIYSLKLKTMTLFFPCNVVRIKGQMRLRELKSARKADHRGGSICIMFQGYCFTANELKVDGIIGESDYND